MAKPLDYQGLETLLDEARQERDVARATVANLARTLRKTLWHDLDCASLCSDDTDCDCDARPTQGDEFTMPALLAAERLVGEWELGFSATLPTSISQQET